MDTVGAGLGGSRGMPSAANAIPSAIFSGHYGTKLKEEARR